MMPKDREQSSLLSSSEEHGRHSQLALATNGDINEATPPPSDSRKRKTPLHEDPRNSNQPVAKIIRYGEETGELSKNEKKRRLKAAARAKMKEAKGIGKKRATAITATTSSNIIASSVDEPQGGRSRSRSLSRNNSTSCGIDGEEHSQIRSQSSEGIGGEGEGAAIVLWSEDPGRVRSILSNSEMRKLGLVLTQHRPPPERRRTVFVNAAYALTAPPSASAIGGAPTRQVVLSSAAVAVPAGSSALGAGTFLKDGVVGAAAEEKGWLAPGSIAGGGSSAENPLLMTMAAISRAFASPDVGDGGRGGGGGSSVRCHSSLHDGVGHGTLTIFSAKLLQATAKEHWGLE